MAEVHRKVLAVDPGQPTKEHEWSILSLFHLIDYNDEGFITKAKMEEAFSAWGLPVGDAAQLTASFAHNDEGVVEFPEFMACFSKREQQIRELFYEVDTGFSGHLTADELSEALQRNKVAISPSEISVFFSHIDRDHNGILSYDEWRDFLLLSPELGGLGSVYGFFSRRVHREGGRVPMPLLRPSQSWKYFLAGAVAGATSRTGTAPLDRLKVLLQVQAGPAKNATGIRTGLRAIYLDGGLKAFWRGNGVNIIKIAPESAVKFYTYEKTKSYTCNDPRDLRVHHRLVAGGIAGLVSQFAIYPLELMKTRLITQSVPRGMIVTFKDIWYKEGPITFYRGLSAALIGVVPYAAIDLTVFETLKVSYMHFFEVDAPSAFALLVCGTVSSTIGSTTVYPMSLIRTRLQAQGATPDAQVYTGMRDVINRIRLQDGYRGFYKGMYPNLLKVVPAVSISYVVYEKMKLFLEIR